MKIGNNKKYIIIINKPKMAQCKDLSNKMIYYYITYQDLYDEKYIL